MLNKWMKVELLPEQQESIAVLPKFNRFLLCDGTGLGKTLSALSSFSVLLEENPNFHMVVICTKTGVVSWINEILTHTNFLHTFYGPDGIDCAGDNLGVLIKEKVSIFGYSTIVKYPSVFKYLYENKKVCLVIDEAHHIKNEDAQITQVVRYLIQYSEVVWGLTATPLLNHLTDLFGVFDSIFPGYLGTEEQFLERYTIREPRMVNVRRKVYKDGKLTYQNQKRRILEITGYQNLDELSSKVTPLMLRRARNLDVRFYYIKAPLPLEEEKRYVVAAFGLLKDSTIKQFSARLPDLQLVTDNAVDLHKELNTSIALSSKELYFIGLVKDLLSKDEGMIVYTSMYLGIVRLEYILRNYIDTSIYPLSIITGGTSLDDRKDIQAAHGKGMIILMTEAGGESINLQRVNNVIFYNIPFSLGHFIQVIGRIARVDSKYPCFNVFLMELLETIDTYKVSLVHHHSALVSKVLAGQCNVPSNTSLLSYQQLTKMRKELLWRYHKLTGEVPSEIVDEINSLKGK